MSAKIATIDWRRAALSALAGAVLCVAALLALPAFAADEDTQASVYLVFDPETGEFVTTHDTQGTAKAKETQEAIDSVADVGDTASGPSGSAPTVTSDAAVAKSPTSPALIAGLVIAALAVIGGAVFLQRRA